MKRLLIILTCTVFLCCTSLPVFAAEQKIVDQAGLISETEKSSLESMATQLSMQYDIDIVIVTVLSLNGKTAETFADDFYDHNDYGQGNDYSGILLLLSMEHRDWAISTCGEGIYALNDNRIQQVFTEISDYLAQNQYYHAFYTYLETLELYLDAYRNGTTIYENDTDYDGLGTYIPGTQNDIIYLESSRGVTWYFQKIGIAFLIGATVSLIVLLVLRSQMNTAKQQHGANSYMCENTYRVELHRDIFLYSQIRKVRKSESSSGGSSVHRSSSGRTHGGGHGKF